MLKQMELMNSDEMGEDFGRAMDGITKTNNNTIDFYNKQTVESSNC